MYGIANLHYEFLNGTTVMVSGTSLANANDRLWSSLGGGGSYSWRGGRYALYGEVSYNTSLSNLGASDSYKGTGGFRISCVRILPHEPSEAVAAAFCLVP